MPDRPSPFLDADALVHLTGRHQKSRQIEWLRAEGIAFHVSATGHPVVQWPALDGQKVKDSGAWQPRAVGA